MDADSIDAQAERDLQRLERSTGREPRGATAEPLGPRFVPIDLSTLMRQDWPAPQFVVEQIIPRDEVTLLGAHGGTGKSMLGLTLAAHVACGQAWGPFAVHVGRAVFVSLEDRPDTVRYRLRQIVETYTLNADAVRQELVVYDGTAGDASLAVEVSAEGVRKIEPTLGMDRLREICAGAALIVIDNASDAYAGNENSRTEVRAFIRMLARIARASHAAVLLLAHIDKSAARFGASGNTYSGSTAWNNSVRSRLALVQGDADQIELIHEKANYGRKADPIVVAFVAHGVLYPQSAEALAEIERDRDETDVAMVLQAVRRAIAAGETLSTARGGSATAWHVLLDAGLRGPEYADAAGRKRVNAALATLVRRGRLRRAAYKKPNRHDGERYEIVTGAPEIAPESARASPPIPPLRTGAAQERLRQCATSAPDATDAQLAHWRTDYVDHGVNASGEHLIATMLERSAK